jgi:hypothetical protein
LFGLTRVWDMHLVIGAKEWAAMQPPNDRGLFGPRPKEPGKGPAGPGAFGYVFPVVRADLVVGGRRYAGVGVRFKGNSSYMVSSRGLKRPFKIDVNRFADGQSFVGLKKLALSNNALDDTQVRESLAYHVFRAGGVPCSRTAFVRLHLTVPGKYDRVLLGLYTLIEPVDRTFLRNRFGSAKGLLLKPERLRGLDYLGESWGRYQSLYRPKTTPTERHKRRLIAFAKLVNQADDSRFRKEIGSYLDLDAFARFVAANAVLANMDSFLALGHNYYLYLDPKTKKFTFMPWDLNHSFGALTMLGKADQLADLSVARPWLGSNRLIERCLAMKDFERAYRGHVKALVEGDFRPDRLKKALAAVNRAIAPALADETKALKDRLESKSPGFPFSLLMGQALPLNTFIDRRAKSVGEQLAGRSKGTVLAGRGPGAPPRQVPAVQVARQVLTAADTDQDGHLSKEEVLAAAHKLFNACDRDKKGAVDQKALRAVLEKALTRPKGPFGAAAKPPAGPGPASSLAAGLFARAGSDRMTVDEAVALAGKLFDEADRDKDGLLNVRELVGALERLLAPGPRVAGKGGTR